MTYSELTMKILSNDRIKTEWCKISEEEVNIFADMLRISKTVLDEYSVGDDANAFLKKYPAFARVLGSDKAVECFYAYRLGFSFNGVPNKLVYILDTVNKMSDGTKPNVAIWRGSNYVSRYADKTFVTPDGEEYTVKDVIDNVFGQNVKLLNDFDNKASIENGFEIYVKECDRIALLPTDIGEQLSNEDIQKITYSTKSGLMLGDIPLRTFNGRLGVTFDDFDLRECL